MPSLSYHIVLAALRWKGVKKLFEQSPVDYKQLREDDLPIPNRWLLGNNSIEQFTFTDDVLITRMLPRKKKNDQQVVLYLPGGAFISGPNLLSWWGISHLVKHTGITAWVVDYPKAPEHKIDYICTQIDKVYAQACQQFGAQNITLLGDSAGGNLGLTLLQRLVKKGEPLPAQFIGISPAVDATFSNPLIDTVDPKDPMLSKAGIKSAKDMCVGHRSYDDPIISPIHGSFEGLPPTHLFIGEYDILFPDQQKAVKKMRAAGVDLSVVVGKEMPHVWPLLPFLREGKQALSAIQKIILSPPKS